MSRLLSTYAAVFYAFLYLPLAVLAVFSFNSSRFTVWEGFSLAWYKAAGANQQLVDGAWNSLVIGTAATVLSTVAGTLCAYALWKRGSRAVTAGLYLSLVTPEIVMGISLLAFYQWIFRYLRIQLGMHTVILAHVTFCLAYVVLVVLARLRTLDPALEEAAMDLGATEWEAFLRVVLPNLVPGIVAGALLAFATSFDDYVITSLVAGVDSENFADGDLLNGPARHQPYSQRDLDCDRLWSRCADSSGSEAATDMTRRAILLGLSGLVRCRRDRRPRLNVLNWSDYVAPDTISNFEREFGALVRYGTYEGAEEMLARIFSGNSGWDVVFPSNYLIRPMVENGLLTRLEHDRLPNLKHLDPIFQDPLWDPGLVWSVPYMWGATGIVFNRSITPPPDSWSSLWERRLEGRITMLDDSTEVIGACLKKLRLSVNATGLAELDRARQEALTQKPLLRAYLNAEVRDQLVAGDVLASQLWATTAQMAIDASGNLAFVFPSEGFPRYADNAVILRESGRQDLAHAFINYLLRPEVAAAVVIATRTATANGAALQLLPEEIRTNPALYPPPGVLERSEWFESLTAPVQRIRDRIWTEIKAA